MQDLSTGELRQRIAELERQLADSRHDHEALVQREAFLRTLNDITYAALEIKGTTELLQMLADRLGEVIGADGCFLTLWDDRHRRVVPVAAYGELKDHYPTIETDPEKPSVTSAVLDSGEPLVIPNVLESPLIRLSVASLFPTRSILALPLIVRGQKLGAALIGFDTFYTFSDDEIALCQQAARQVALAVQNAITFDELTESEERYRQIFEANLAIKLVIDARSGRIIRANQAASDFYGYTLEEISSMFITDINIDGVEEVQRQMAMAASGEKRSFSFRHRLKSGEIRNVEVFSGPLTVGGRDLLYSIITDVTERVQLEEQLLNAHKMEAVGRMAGGIAHDFNNLLTLIVGSFDIARDAVKAPADLEVIDRGMEAAERAASLTRQLLAASRKQVTDPERLDLNQQIEGMRKMLASLMGDDNPLSVELAAESPCIEIDRSQLEQVMINLIVNARDAMPAGEPCVIRTWNTSGGAPRQVVLSVVDRGKGIDSETRRRMFEPFFTTKGDAGTGLGLATVYGIVRECGGSIDVRSEPGEGTEMRLYLPVAEGPDDADGTVASAETVSGEAHKPATILVAEDNEGILALTRRTLEMQGYRVIAAADGHQALEALDAAGEPLDLLLTDVLMPGISGRELAKQVRERQPGVPILYMSGYTDDAIDGGLEDNAVLLSKPFRPSALAAQIADMLDGRDR